MPGHECLYALNPIVRMQHYGWPSVFYVFAVLGLAWAAVWPLVRPETRDPVMLREAEMLEEIEAKRAERHAAKRRARGDALDGGPAGGLANGDSMDQAAAEDTKRV